MVLSRVERASLWKVMMMLVGGRSLQYTSRAHLGKERQETSKTFKGKGDLRSWNQGHCDIHQHGQMPGVQWGQPSCTALGKTPGRASPGRECLRLNFPPFQGNVALEPNEVETQNIKVGFLACPSESTVVPSSHTNPPPSLGLCSPVWACPFGRGQTMFWARAPAHHTMLTPDFLCPNTEI